MTNDIFLMIKLNQKNEFRTTASFEINGMKFSAIDVKINTGCPHTSQSFVAALSELIDVRKV